MKNEAYQATRALADFVAKTTYDRLPLEVIHEVKRRTLDILGIALNASKTEPGMRLAQYALNQKIPGKALLWGRNEKVSPSMATFVNTSMIFYMELDDVHRTSHCHPAVTTIPPALALADEMGFSGKDVICAVTVGYDVENRLGNAVSPSIFIDRPFLPAATLGTLGAAGVAAKLYNLDSDKVLTALGTAAYLTPIALFEGFKEGAPAKELAIGWAAATGITAVDLATQGFEGPTSWLEGSLGLVKATADRYDMKRLVEKIGQVYEILNSGIKPYSCCRQHHTAIDAALEIRERYAPAAEDVERIVHRTFSVASRGNNTQPNSVSAAKYSAPFSIATALIEGRAWRQDYTLEKIADKRMMSLAAKVEVIADEELEKVYDFKWPSIIEVYMKDGRSFKAQRDLPKGEPEHSLSDEELKDKFMDLACDVVSSEKAGKIFQTVWNLENLDETHELTQLMRID
jgi:2-methylcitrate dehydratase PrpD